MARAGEYITVEIKGLDVYDPTRGEVRTASTDDIACLVHRHRLRRHAASSSATPTSPAARSPTRACKALKADIDADAWASLYSTVSRPFPVPSTGKIAVKVINHYGDEVLQVYDVSDQGGT